MIGNKSLLVDCTGSNIELDGRAMLALNRRGRTANVLILKSILIGKAILHVETTGISGYLY
jgi:hypothetical protein